MAVKKTKINIIDGDSSQESIKQSVKENKKIKKTFKKEDDFDMKAVMRKKLANTVANNLVDLTKEPETKLSKLGEKNETKTDLRDRDKVRDFDNVTERLREKFKAVIGNKGQEEVRPGIEKIATENQPIIESVEAKTGESIIAPTKTEIKIEAVPNQIAKIETSSEIATVKISTKLYRNIAYFFLFCTFLLVAAIFYFYGTKMTISITPKQERISDNLLVEISDTSRGVASNTSSTIGIVEAVPMELTKKYSTTGEKVIGENVVGKVTVYNNYIKVQPLVATTRLLSADGILFRLKNAVSVPVNGSVEAEVYADKPTPDMEVAPTKFTIPGLWSGIQDKIYAESKDTIKYAQQTEKYLQQSDLDSAFKDLIASLAVESKSQLKDKYKDYTQLLYSVDESSITTSTSDKIGDKLDEFSAQIKADVVVVAFNDDNISKLAKEKLTTSLAAGKELTEFNKEQIVYKLDNFDLKEKVANVNVSFEGTTMYSKNANIVDKEQLDGLNASQVASYLGGLPGIDSFQVKYSPSWFKVVPKMTDRINIEIVK